MGLQCRVLINGELLVRATVTQERNTAALHSKIHAVTARFGHNARLGSHECVWCQHCGAVWVLKSVAYTAVFIGPQLDYFCPGAPLVRAR